MFKETPLLENMNYVFQFKFKTLEVCLIGNDDLKRAEEPYEIFIGGETIDLVIPSVRAIVHDNWHSWFNDPETNRYIDYGLFPNTRKSKLIFYQAARAGLPQVSALNCTKRCWSCSWCSQSLKHRFYSPIAENAVVIGNGQQQKSMFWR